MAWCVTRTADDVQPLFVFVGFVASVVLMLVVVVCSIAVYRRTRPPRPTHAPGSARLLAGAGRKRAAAAASSRHQRAPADRDVIRLTPAQDTRPASNSVAAQLSQTDAADV